MVFGGRHTAAGSDTLCRGRAQRDSHGRGNLLYLRPGLQPNPRRRCADGEPMVHRYDHRNYFPHHYRQLGRWYGWCSLFCDALRLRRIRNRHLHLLAGLRDSASRPYAICQWSSVGHANDGGNIHVYSTSHQHLPKPCCQLPASYRNTVVHGDDLSGAHHHHRER